MIFIQFILNLLVVVAMVMCVSISLQTPWVKANIFVTQGYFKMSVPVEVGLLKCFSEICDRYEDIRKVLRPHHKSSNNSNDATVDDSKQQPSTSANTDDATHSTDDQSASFRLPDINKIKIPKIPPFDITKPPNYQPPHMVDQAIKREEKHFRAASEVTIPLLALSMLVALVSLLTSIVKAILYQLHSFQLQNSLLLVAMLLLFAATMSYILMTMKFIHGGSYLDGVWICGYCCVAGLICTVASIALEQQTVRYIMVNSTGSGNGANGNGQWERINYASDENTRLLPRDVELGHY